MYEYDSSACVCVHQRCSYYIDRANRESPQLSELPKVIRLLFMTVHLNLDKSNSKLFD